MIVQTRTGKYAKPFWRSVRTSWAQLVAKSPVTCVASQFCVPGGGYEMRFPYAIPPEFIRVIKP